MLEAMKRGYTRAELPDPVRKLRAAMPGLALSTDLMVGFCGETEADHQDTLSLMREVRFDSAFMFRYSDRGITYAAPQAQRRRPGIRASSWAAPTASRP
jgi:tRNA-2-methylthio-N6-dimethylallyladenosine synthase